VVATCVALTVGLMGRVAYGAIRQNAAVPTWQASQFWLTYEHGFVRRGLPGQLLHAVVGGSPTAVEVDVAAVLLAVCAAAALAAVAVQVAAAALDFRSRLVVTAVVACSPFTLSLLVQDLGRYDAIGVVAILGIGLLAGRVHTPLGAVAVALLAVSAVGAEEFLIVFVAPVVVAAVVGRSQARSGLIIGALLAPAAVFAAASFVFAPARTSLVSAVAAAHEARPDITVTGRSAVAALTQTPQQALGELAAMLPLTMPVLTVVLGGFWLVSILLLWHLVGAPQRARARRAAGSVAAAAVALSIVGVDYRRWWALAFVAFLAVLHILVRRQPETAVRTAVRPASPRWAMVGAVVLLASVVLQQMPVAASYFDPAAETALYLEAPPR
jgi:hypothetical protein